MYANLKILMSSTTDLLTADDPEADVEVREAVVSRLQHALRLDKALVALAPEFSRSWLQQLLARSNSVAYQILLQQLQQFLLHIKFCCSSCWRAQILLHMSLNRH